MIAQLPNREDARRLAAALVACALEQGVNVPKVSTRRMRRLPAAVVARYARHAMITSHEPTSHFDRRAQETKVRTEPRLVVIDGGVILKMGGAY